MKFKFLSLSLLAASTLLASADNVIEEVAWVVGDEPIYKSEIEEQYMQLQYDREDLNGDPYCMIPEQMAIQKLFLHQAKIDTVTVQDATIFQEVERRINYFVTSIGSKEKVEEYFRKPMPDLRESLREMIRDQYTIEEVKRTLTKDIKPTPSDVRKYYNTLTDEQIPFVPTQVEVQIISLNPVIPQAEIDEVKSRLRDYANRVNSGESEFSTLAILYSEDASAMYGGELGFKGRSSFVPEFSSVAFNLNDPKKVSKIVETEFGYHIIQLIEKRGDLANFRHIILRPKIAEKDLTDGINRLDSLRTDILANKFSFEDAALYVSQDKDSKNNKGMMVYVDNMTNESTTRFEMSQLPQEISKKVNEMKEGEISEPFIMMNPKTNREVVAIVKLKNRIEGHKANLAEDYQKIKNLYEVAQQEKIIKDWVLKKQKETYVKIEDGWRNCDFEYDGWLKK